jgi:hypothetical protein
MQFQYVDAHIPSRTSAFTTRLAAIAVHVNNFASGAIGPVGLRLMSVTTAITVVTGVMKRNHRVKISAKFSGNQCGMRRSASSYAIVRAVLIRTFPVTAHGRTSELLSGTPLRELLPREPYVYNSRKIASRGMVST